MYNSRIDEALDDWSEAKQEISDKLELGRIDNEHLRLIDNIEEKFITLQEEFSVTDDPRVKEVCEEAESLRHHVRDRLLHIKTTEGIPYKVISPADSP